MTFEKTVLGEMRNATLIPTGLRLILWIAGEVGHFLNRGLL